METQAGLHGPARCRSVTDLRRKVKAQEDRVLSLRDLDASGTRLVKRLANEKSVPRHIVVVMHQLVLQVIQIRSKLVRQSILGISSFTRLGSIALNSIYQFPTHHPEEAVLPFFFV